MFKSFDTARDIVNQLTTVNEVVAFGSGIFTGSVVLGEHNIKKFNHWISGSGVSGSFYHALYNQNFSQSLAVELLNVAFGYSISSSYFSNSVYGVAGGGDTANQVTEKTRIYKLFAKQLLGSEESFFTIDGESRHELIFLAVRRSQYKDEIKKGTVSILMVNSGSGGAGASPGVEWSDQIFTDDGAVSSFARTERGDTAPLVSGSLVGGLVFYQAGILALIPEIISNTGSADVGAGDEGNFWSASFDYNSLVFSGGGSNASTDPGRVDNLLDAVRFRIKNLSIVNQSNLHSTFYFCRALNDEFNYSSNPTFIDTGGRIIPTSGTTDLSTRSYITKVGLMGENSDVLAVASLSQPLKKTPDGELLIKVRLDY